MATSDELKRRIPGWGADLRLEDRPSYPKKKAPTEGTGAHWTEPARQLPGVRIFRSTEHKGLTPVFGSTCPPKGLSGLIREHAYTLSEGRKSRWLFLILADRVDVVESSLMDALRGKPDRPIREIGLRSELKHGAFRTRFGQHRTDVRRQEREVLVALGVVAVSWIASRVIGRKAA